MAKLDDVSLWATLNFRWDGAETRRYHSFRMVQEDTVGHHSHNVMSNVLAIMPEASRDLLIATHDHDGAEHISGDMPAPAKRGMGIRDTVNGFEAELMARYGLGKEEARLSNVEKWVLKVADSMDGMRYCISELKMGNRKAIGIYAAFASYVKELLDAAPLPLSRGNETYDRASRLYSLLWGEWRYYGGE